MKRLLYLTLLLLCLVSCSSFRMGNTDAYVIRYVDLPKVYAYAVKHDGGAPLKGGETRQEEGSKNRIYGKIKTAISNVARRHDADFVLNTGDAVLYSRSTYDITDDVIREYKKLTDISSPDVK